MKMCRISLLRMYYQKNFRQNTVLIFLGLCAFWSNYKGEDTMVAIFIAAISIIIALRQRGVSY